MHDQYQSNKHTFFQPFFEELHLLRKPSECSLLGGHPFVQIYEDEFDLQLEIQDVVDVADLSLDFELAPLSNSFFTEESSNQSINKCNRLAVCEGSLRNEDISNTKEDEDLPAPKNTTKAPKEKKISKLLKTPKRKFSTPKTFYEKNICRNIIRKAIRAIESESYKAQILFLCGNNLQFYTEFRQILVSQVQLITGPTALKAFMSPFDDVAKIFKGFLLWFLKERYIREAMDGGHMSDLEKYIAYKNTVLMPLIHDV